MCSNERSDTIKVIVTGKVYLNNPGNLLLFTINTICLSSSYNKYYNTRTGLGKKKRKRVNPYLQNIFNIRNHIFQNGIKLLKTRKCVTYILEKGLHFKISV